MAAEIGMTVAFLLGQNLVVPPQSGSADAVSDARGAASVVPQSDSAERRRLLLMAGAAAGVAANSNVPLTGILFVVEIASKMGSLSSGAPSGASRLFGLPSVYELQATPLVLAAVAAGESK